MENQNPNSKEVIIPLEGPDPQLGNFRVTKIVCSRSIKTSAGEVYFGMSACAEPGSTLKQARVSALRLGLEVVRMVYQRAMLERTVPADLAQPLVAEIVQDYIVAIWDEVPASKPSQVAEVSRE